MKNSIKYILQKLLGYERYLFIFSKHKIRTLKKDKKEGDFFAFMKAIENEGDILDVGANIGIMTAHLSQTFPKRTIHCIEPVPSNLKILKKIIYEYNLINAKVHNVAVGNEEKELEMVLPVHQNVKMQGLAHVVHDSIYEWNEGEKFKVQSKKLDTLFSDTPIAGIKMDIENFEFFALDGAREILTKYKPVVYLELWENENREKCFELLESLGYEAFVAWGDELKPFKDSGLNKQNFIFK